MSAAIFQQDVWDLDLIVNYVFLQPIPEKHISIAWYLMCFLVHKYRHSGISGCETRGLDRRQLACGGEAAFLTAACFFGKPLMEEVCFGH